jgi:two-component sensor histidine kinase
MLLWLAARCRPVFAAGGAFVVAFTVVWTTIFGIGHFGDPGLPIEARILQAQAVIMVVTVGSFVLAALFAERRRTENHQKMLMAELDHRVKNVLARVAAVADSTRQGHGSIDEFIRSYNGRIQSMAAAHSLMSQAAWKGTDLAALVRNQLAPYATDANMTIFGTDIMLSAPATQAVAMVLHELVTNAVKYGALSVPGGRVSVSWERKLNGSAAANLILVWRELGGPPVAATTHSGYGTDLIRNLIPHELGGRVALAFVKQGVNCQIEVPLKQA